MLGHAHSVEGGNLRLVLENPCCDRKVGLIPKAANLHSACQSLFTSMTEREVCSRFKKF